MKAERVAVTGGSGRLGRRIIERFRGEADVTSVDVRPSDEDVRFVQADARDFNAVEAALAGHDAVVHLAAVPDPRSAPGDVTFSTNVNATWNVLQAAENAGVRRVVVASSDAATGLLYNPNWTPQYLPVDEDHPVQPTDFYGLSKKVTEDICRAYTYRGKLEVVIIRPTLIAFPWVLPELAARGADVDNHHIWSYVDPEDVAQGFYLAMGLDDLTHDTFFISATNCLGARPTLEMMEERLGRLPEVRKPEVYERDPYASVIDTARARSVLGYQPKSDWRRLFAQVPVEDRVPVPPT